MYHSLPIPVVKLTGSVPFTLLMESVGVYQFKVRDPCGIMDTQTAF